MQGKRALSAAFVASVACAGLIREDRSTKTLVMLDDWATVGSHSLFFKHISDTLDHQIEFAMADKGPVNLEAGASAFDNIIMIAPSQKESSLLDGFESEKLAEYLSEGKHNLMVFANAESRRAVRRLANQFGVDFEESGFSL